MQQNEDAARMMNNMWENGMIKQDADGGIQVVEDPNERKIIQDTNRKNREAREQREME